MPTLPQFLVCEKTGFWAAAIRWQQGALPVPLRQLRSLTDLRESWQESPNSIAAVEVTLNNAEAVLQLMLESRRLHDSARFILLITPPAAPLTHLFLEVGPALVVSMRQLNQVVQLVERHLAAQELPSLSLRESVWARLPWQR
jgi:hypothetical protein